MLPTLFILRLFYWEVAKAATYTQVFLKTSNFSSFLLIFTDITIVWYHLNLGKLRNMVQGGQLPTLYSHTSVALLYPTTFVGKRQCVSPLHLFNSSAGKYQKQMCYRFFVLQPIKKELLKTTALLTLHFANIQCDYKLATRKQVK